MFAISLLTVHIVLSGLLFSIPVYAFFNQQEQMRGLVLLNLALLSGLLINFLTILVIRSLYWSFATGIVIDLAGIFMLFRASEKLTISLFPREWDRATWRNQIVVYALCLVVIAVIAYKAFFLPITAWDSRSIWFFQGKIIYYAGGLFADAGWDSMFSHPDYPKLIPTLAAQIAMLSGYWNEYLPLTLVPMLLCVECILLAYLAESPLFLAFWLVLVCRFVGASEYFVNGYADLHLAMMAMLGAGFFVRFILEKNRMDAVLAILSLGVAACLKNEGLFLAAIVSIVAGGIYWLDSRLRPLLISRGWIIRSTLGKTAMRPVPDERQKGWMMRSENLAFFAVALLAATPVLLWAFISWRWNLVNDLVADGHAASRILSRLNMENLTQIIHALGVNSLLIIAVLAGGLSCCFKDNRVLIFFIPILVSLLYFLLLIVIYLSMPFDLTWYLITTVERTSLPIKFMVIFGLARMIDLGFNRLLGRARKERA